MMRLRIAAVHVAGLDESAGPTPQVPPIRISGSVAPIDMNSDPKT